MKPLLALVLLVACDGPKSSSTDTGSTDSPVDTADSAIDTGPAPTDGDKDGYDSTTDCNDKDHTIHPDAEELCNAVDDDCDGTVDEGFDADADGQTSAELCADGTDCDDTDGTIAPGAAEVPYDGIDQDCDGADLVDVDGDHYDYTFDCDDENAEVNPGATEIPKNGLDDDCVDGDSADTDGDGYADDNFGGDDCDDADPDVHPGARDLWSDGLDADCDGLDARMSALADAPVTIEGDSGAQALVGETVTWCDLDEDGLDDLVVTAPFGDSYAGQIGIWYGNASASWGPGMAMTDADTLIGSTGMFFGFGASCADVDGDGHEDLVTTRGEIHYSSYDSDYEVMVFYGSGGAWPATMDEGDVGTRLAYPLAVTPNIPNVFAQRVTVGDLDGNGAADLVINDATNDNLASASGKLYVVAGAQYGDMNLQDAVIAVLDLGDESASRVKLFSDLDGDGTADMFVGEHSALDSGVTSDTAGGTISASMGQAFFTDASMVDAAVQDLAWRSWHGRIGDGFGWDAQVFDTDADGDDDAVISALGTPGDYSGALYFYDGIPEDGGPDNASAELLGSTTAGEFGFSSALAADVDGDGIQDLLVSEVLGGSGQEGVVWLVSTGLARSGVGDVESASRLAWTGEEADANTGVSLAAGDADGDGSEEYAVAAETWADGGSYTLGKVYVLF